MTHFSEYNCGGFALGTNTWVVPYTEIDDDTDTYKAHEGEYTEIEREGFIRSLIDEGYDRLEVADQLLQKDAAFLLSHYKFLQASDGEVDESTTLIAYRLSVPDITSKYFDPEDIDFHFRIRINGFWFEKKGKEPVRLCTDCITDPWESTDDLIYDSDIFYFVKSST